MHLSLTIRCSINPCNLFIDVPTRSQRRGRWRCQVVLHVFWGTMGYCLHPTVLSVVVDGVITLVLHVVWGTVNGVVSAPTRSQCRGRWRYLLVPHVFGGTMGYFLHPPVLNVVVDGVIFQCYMCLGVQWGIVWTHPFSVSW